MTNQSKFRNQRYILLTKHHSTLSYSDEKNVTDIAK